MPNDVKLSVFPDNRLEALAMLYLQSQNLSNLSPEQILDMYDESYDKIKSHYKDTRTDRRRIGWSQE